MKLRATTRSHKKLRSRLQLYLTLKESEALSISRKRPGVEQKGGSSKAASIRGQSPAIACNMTLLRTEHV